MKHMKRFFRLGLPLMLLGCGLLGVGYPTKMNDHNWYLLLSLLAVVLGIVLYVADKKRNSKY